MEYVSGKQLLADMLSRATATALEDDTASEDDIEIHAVSKSQLSCVRSQRLAEETDKDPHLSTVIRGIRSNTSIKGKLKPVVSKLSVVEGVLLKGYKVVVPAVMRGDILNRIHQRHMGLSKCKARTLRFVFWQGLNADATALVRRCGVGKRYAYSQPSEPLILRPTPKFAWYRAGVDLFQFGGKSYLSAYDTLSNFPEVQKLNNTSCTTVIEMVGAIFARYGIPVEGCTENGPQFSSR